MKHLKRIPVFFSLLLIIGLVACKSSQPNSAANDTLNQAQAAIVQADQIAKQLDLRTKTNPTSAVRDFIPYIEEKKQRVKKISDELNVLIASDKKASKSQRTANDARIQELATELKQITFELGLIDKSMAKELDVTLKADVLFATGSAKLSSEGKEAIARLISADIKALIDNWNTDPFLKEKEKLVKLYINGYADKQGVRDDRKRQTSNTELSRERAASVEGIIREQLEQLKANYPIAVEISPEGHGEALPPGVEDNGKSNDPRRRICMVSAYVIPRLQVISQRE